MMTLHYDDNHFALPHSNAEKMNLYKDSYFGNCEGDNNKNSHFENKKMDKMYVES